ncbi:MAG: S-layer homology domain-containing protein [Oscillospiraceae bacterium]|nr:S-layer homology domain-containing protein [Oscillospiraceae bacterium]
MYFYISDAYITGFENAFDFVEAEDYKDIVIDASSLNITNISGSVSNGGNWNIWGNMSISDCAGTGLTADYIGIYGDASLTVCGIGSSGIVTGGLNVAENSSLTVSGCGSKLPIASAEAPDGVSYKYPVEIRAGGNVTIGYDAKLVLEGNNINSVYLVSGSFSNEGEVTIDVVTEDEYFWKVEIEGLPTQVIPKGEYELTMPEAPSKPGYIFLGWSYNGSTYAPGDVVPIDGPMTVKAVWGSLPSVSEPEETPAEPVTPAPVYTDVSAGDWYYEAVEYVSSEGLMDGVSEGEFAPGATLTRAMVWTILARYLTA